MLDKARRCVHNTAALLLTQKERWLSWSKALDSKSSVVEISPWVRIPLSPLAAPEVLKPRVLFCTRGESLYGERVRSGVALRGCTEARSVHVVQRPGAAAGVGLAWLSGTPALLGGARGEEARSPAVGRRGALAAGGTDGEGVKVQGGEAPELWSGGVEKRRSCGAGACASLALRRKGTRSARRRSRCCGRVLSCQRGGMLIP